MTRIASESLLIDVDSNFKVSAGPGAGKTYWLIQHIKNVLHRSKILGRSRKIACVTYTNIGVETIQSRLSSSVDRLEVSTIHSFLYQHVLKPFASFIPMDHNVDVEKMDGPDDLILTNYSTLQDLKAETKQKRIRDDDALVKAIQNAKWKFVEGHLVCKPKWPHKVDGYPLKADTYFAYKKIAWGKGIIHHDDVLYLSNLLIERRPFILDILRAKFPYFFVDEFQDTNPIQSNILQKLAARETIVGVVGDPAQSIYEFQGADINKFIDFCLPGMEDFTIHENKRSTKNIVSVLNRIRSDIKQEATRIFEGSRPIVIVGGPLESFNLAKNLCKSDIVHTLTYENIASIALKQKIKVGDIENENLLLKLKSIDSNNIRSQCILASIGAMEMAKESQYKDAIRLMSRAFPSIKDREVKKATALKGLMTLLTQYDELKAGTVMHLYEGVKDGLNLSLAGFKAGKIKKFYEEHTYQQLSVHVSVKDEISVYKTIHKAKGDEFDNVLLVLTDEKNLGFLLDPDLLSDKNEEQRVYYVAVSRAVNNLLISVPILSEEKEQFLSSNFSVVRI